MSASADAGAPPATCDNFAGFHSVNADVSCNFQSAPMPRALCVVQEGCHLTVMTDTVALSGEANGHTFTLSSDHPTQVSCEGDDLNDDLHLKCHFVLPLARAPFDCEFATTAQMPLSDEARYCCDPVKQDCGSNAKCELVFAGQKNELIATACLPESGSGHEGDECMRMGPDSTNVGHDDCAPGFYCTRLGVGNNDSRLCRKLCNTQADCGTGQSCLVIGTAPVSGACIESCTLLGSDCPANTTCRTNNSLDAHGLQKKLPSCSSTGTSAVDGTCNSDFDCPDETVCNYHDGDRALYCRTLCDDAHQCPDDGHQCFPFDSTSGSSLGVCVK